MPIALSLVRYASVSLIAAFAVVAFAIPASAHNADFPIAGEKMMVKTNDGKHNRKFIFKASGDRVIRIGNHDPSVDGTTVVVNSTGDEPSSSGLINLEGKYWSRIEEGGDLIGWRYQDKKGRNGGVTKVVLKNGKLQLKAKGKNWKWKPKGKEGSVWVHFGFEEEEYCAEFSKESGAKVSRNKKGQFQASQGVPPAICPESTCGNGETEPGEQCDDGNRNQKDGCNNDCTIGVCEGEEFDTTYAAIQSVIFDSDVYRCSNDACHGAAKEGDLDLRANASYEALIDVESPNGGGLLVQRQEPDHSLLFEKVLAKFEDRSASNGSSMPVGAPALSEPHLSALREWIRAGAPEELVVDGTGGLGCQPPPDPLKIPVPDPPGDGIGVQLTATPRPLLATAEDEICMSTYYDFSDIVPEFARFPCPEEYARKQFCAGDPDTACTTDEDCGDKDVCYQRSNLNPTDECFYFHRIEALQDSQSHHSIQFMYAGTADVDDAGWGSWTYKFDDVSNPAQGTECDPTEIDEALGYNPGCSSDIRETVACIGYGPWDFSNLFALFGVDGNAISVNVSQEPIHDFTYADGVYEVLPVQGVMTWNSHAFNLTQKDSTLGQYLNLYYAQPEDQLYPIQGIFDASAIFVQYVPPYEKREYCQTYTMPKNGRLVRFTSHTHRHGTLFRAWEPPNTPCRPACDPKASLFCNNDPGTPICTGSREDEPFYYSTLYNDPLQIEFEPPLEFDQENIEDRTYLYCADFDNGSTPTSPSLKRHSTSPPPPLASQGNILGGPCPTNEITCVDGPNTGELCHSQPEGFCDSAPGAGDGECDACPVRGGVTTEDEMFILLGDMYCEGECEYDDDSDEEEEEGDGEGAE